MDRRHTTWDWLTRRAFLGTAAGATAGFYGLAQGFAAEIPNTFDGKDFKLRAPEPNAKRGGVLRYGTLSARRILMCTNQALLPTWALKGRCMTT